MNDREYDPELVAKFFNEYQDRGTVKWQGFYLSDHTAAVKKEENSINENTKRTHAEEMSSFKIQEVINMAIKKEKQVIVDLRFLNNNLEVTKPIVGRIEGYYQTKLLIGNKYVDINDIYSIRV
ncbi:hypothetical protein RD055328_08920 [Companilactobacillus sp. RD055328]|uniref:hypothetical protein n=1 Tax=Companilactobacillus sp. RD055328 TaxID=2916634 RepID=UPI001FC88554|nr:hypothetical protein [Companilactobacillus sp. RD055328]GKQ42969.1 hypothetical protein RD055328_08920 [Companilactobacillus sp. RD055328]